MQGVIKAVCISEAKGTEKHPVPSAHLTAQHGVDGDAHAGVEPVAAVIGYLSILNFMQYLYLQ